MNLDAYQAPSPHVEAIHPYWIEAFVGDAMPRPGEALKVVGENEEVVYAEVVALAGARRVEAILPKMPDWMKVGLAVSPTGKPVGFVLPSSQSLELDEHLFVPHEPGRTVMLRGERPALMDLDGRRPPIMTGIAGVDRFSPVAGHGLNLVIDLGGSTKGWARLVQAVQKGIDGLTTLNVGPQDLESLAGVEKILNVHSSGDGPDHVMALRIGMRWAASLRDEGEEVFFIGALPFLEEATPFLDEAALRGPARAGAGLGDMIDLMGDVLVSMKGAPVTSLVRLDLGGHRDGLGQIIETMNLGAVDAQIVIDSSGRLDLSRSHSRADVAPDAQQVVAQMLARDHRIRERYALLGEDDLDPGDLEFLEEMERLAEL